MSGTVRLAVALVVGLILVGMALKCRRWQLESDAEDQLDDLEPWA